MSYTTVPDTVTNITPSFNLIWTDQEIPQSGTYSLYFYNGEIEFLIRDGQYVSVGEISFLNINFNVIGDYTVRVVNADVTNPLNPNYYNVTAQTQLTIACFCEGTEILCDNNEYEKIENLKIGTKIQVYKNESKKIIHIYKNTYKNNKDELHRIFKICNYENQTKDLFLTGGHSILVSDLTENEIKRTNKYWNEMMKIEDKYLLLSCVNEKAKKIENNEIYNVYHIVLENDDENGQYGIYSNGVLSETMSINCYKNITKNKKISIC